MDFTIITPSLNQAQFLEKTIESILSQEGDFTIEYLVYDAVSKDGSVDILKKYDDLLSSGKYPVRCKGIKFFWISEKDRGHSHAMNKGIEKASGKIIGLCNSDDYYERGALARVHELFKMNPEVDLVHGDAYFLYEATGVKNVKKSKQMDFEELTTSLNRVNCPSTFFTKRIIEKVGPHDESLHFCPDYDLWIRIFREGKTLYVPEVFATFRLWENSKTVSSQEEFTKEMGLIHKKYGLSVLNTKHLQHMTSREPFVSFKKYFPRAYGFFKEFFYSVVKKIKYRVS